MNPLRPPLPAIALGAALLAALSAGAGYRMAQSHGHSATVSSAAARARQPLYWYDPMRPDQHFDKPGKSPFMDMQLIPKYAAAGGDAEQAALEIDPAIVQNLGIRLGRVERGSLPQRIDAIGSVEFNQRDIAIIQARSNGFVTRVYARAPGDVISQGAPIVDLLVPEWAAAQTEFLALLKSSDRDLTDAARQRLVLLGMPPQLIERIEATRELRTTITIRSPRAGMIATLEARDGMTVSAGATLAKINGLRTVWIEAAVPEARAALAQLGSHVEARLTAYPGQRFAGRVIGVLPQANVETRTLRVRIELDNRDGRLRPGMFAQVHLDTNTQASAIYVASEAVIRTGTRAIVIATDERGRFIPKEVQPGADVEGKTVILSGLTEGQTVVTSGQFLIDSEASLKGVLSRLTQSTPESDTDATGSGTQP
ncbi:MAG TPA: efflux RND transporter periplasmic adaptor subunit [Steroidobacteraceae bacterium]|nr:efflux RND transporter periplasmic adaptor subunit [Steroidobacteraceae bacterium]